MKNEVRRHKKIDLALAIAGGKAIAAWASQNDVPLRTAYRCSRDPQVRGEVQEWRRFVLDLTIGRLARLSLKATDGIAKLGAGAESESVRLRAYRAILADQDGRLQVLGSRVPHAGDRGAARGTRSSWPCSNALWGDTGKPRGLPLAILDRDSKGRRCGAFFSSGDDGDDRSDNPGRAARVSGRAILARSHELSEVQESEKRTQTVASVK